MKTPYKETAYNILIERQGKDKDEAKRIVNLLTNDEIETHVHVKDSFNEGINSIARLLNLSDQEKEELINASYNGPLEAPIFKRINELINGIDDKEEFVLAILSNIHDQYIRNNCTEEIFNQKIEEKELRQYVPLPLIGYNEVLIDLLFLKPLLMACGLDTDTLRLPGEYHFMVYQFLMEHNIKSLEELRNKIGLIQICYEPFSIKLTEKMIHLSDEVAKEIYENWDANDKVSAITILQIERNEIQRKKELEGTKEQGIEYETVSYDEYLKNRDKYVDTFRR